ncbi:MAG TPA: hypothetical protein VJA94_21915 [Candidatus Angelobacter sp.]
MQMRTAEALYKKPDEIDCTFHFAETNGEILRRVLIVSFSGTYPPGSEGNRHAKYITIMAMYGLVAFEPACLVLDFSDLSYSWGDALLGVFAEVGRYKNEKGEPPFPVLAVTSEKCRKAFLSLVTLIGAPEPEWHYRSLEQAVPAAIAAAERWLDA